MLCCLDPEDAAETLVDLANFRGGPDNISVVVAQVDGAVPPNGRAWKVSAKRRAVNRWPTAPLWIAAGAFLGNAWAIVFRTNIGWRAVGSAIGFVAAAIAGLAFRSTAPVQLARRFGRSAGPTATGRIARLKCTPNGKVVATLAEIAAKLREQSEQGPRRP